MSRIATMSAGMAVAVLLAACQPYASKPDETAAAPETADMCGASKVTDWVGKTDSPAARTAIATASGAKNIRWLTPGMAVTMDYRQDRLNANIDAAGKFTGFTCT
jgi:Peptidase inhibitor I78 family